jgi:four helix bundle suffix protein
MASQTESLIPRHGGYRKLKSFQVARLVYDVTVRFCDEHIERFSRTRDQMVQAARSGVQNIAEGSQASGTSKKTELTLTNVARASLEELRLDYEDFLRQRRLACWEISDPRRRDLVASRPQAADEFAAWVKETRNGQGQGNGRNGRDGQVEAEIAANGAHALVGVACSLLDRQIAALVRAFEHEGGFSERLYRYRAARRGSRDQEP